MKHYTRLVPWMCLLLAGCSAQAPGPSADAAPAAADSRAIRVDLNVYTPGTVPQGIGEPVKMAQVLADEWAAGRAGGRTIKYQQLINTGNSEGEWLKTQLIGGVAPEIVSMNAEVSWPDVSKGWYVPLDDYLKRPNPYVPGNKHWIDIFMNRDLVDAKRAPDGKLYCISMDIVETGIFYNKNLLRQCGIEKMPETWAEMLAVMDTLDRAGITPLASPFNLASDWGQDIIFEMLYHDIIPQMDLIPSSKDASGYLTHYLEPREAGFLYAKGFFTPRDPRWREMNRIVKEWRRYWTKELKNTDPVRLFLTGRLAMFWNGSWFIRRMATDPYVNFDWGVAYIPTITKATSRYGSGTPATVIGGAAVQLHVTNSALLNHNVEDCVDYLMYLTAPQNIERMASEALVYIPNIKEAHMDPRLAPFSEIFQRPYCAIKWLESMDGEYKKYWRRMLDYYLNDGVDLDGFLGMLDGNFQGWVASHRDKEGWDFTPMEPVWNERGAALLRELDPAS